MMLLRESKRVAQQLIEQRLKEKIDKDVISYIEKNAK